MKYVLVLLIVVTGLLGREVLAQDQPARSATTAVQVQAEKQLLGSLPLLSAQKVTVYRNLAGSPYPHMNEEKFKRVSCTYQVEDRGLIRVLVRLLEGSDMQINGVRDDFQRISIFTEVL